MSDISPVHVAAHSLVGGVVGGGLMLLNGKLGAGKAAMHAMNPRMVAMGAASGLVAAGTTEALHEQRGAALSNMALGAGAGAATGAATVGVLGRTFAPKQLAIGLAAGAGLGVVAALGSSFAVPLVLGDPS